MTEKNYKKVYLISLVSLIFLIIVTIFLKRSGNLLSMKELYQSYSLIFLFCTVCFLQPESKQVELRFWKLIYSKITEPKILVLNGLIIILSILLLSLFKHGYLKIAVFTLFQVYIFYIVLSLVTIDIRKWLFHLNLYLFFFSIFFYQIAYYNPFGSLSLHLLF